MKISLKHDADITVAWWSYVIYVCLLFS